MKTIKDLSVLELKAAIYDHSVQIEHSSAIIKACKSELAERANTVPNDAAKTVEEVGKLYKKSKSAAKPTA